MKNLLTLILFYILISCSDDAPRPNCVPDAPEKPGIYSKQIGVVSIAGEECQVFETYEKFNCGDGLNIRAGNGCWYKCDWVILTRITKCPSHTTTNAITQTGGKFSHEEIR